MRIKAIAPWFGAKRNLADGIIAELGVLVIRLTIKQATTQNKMWATDPQQKLFYSAVVKWARRHRPEIMLGVLTDDDIEKIKEDISPPEQSKPQLPIGRVALPRNGKHVEPVVSGSETKPTPAE